MRYGSLFSGYEGLSMGVQSVIPGDTAWVCDFDTGPSKLLAHHWPEVPNLHDVTAVDWTAVEPVDVITGGSPCQDVSAAGRRAGMRAGTRSGLWASMCDAIDIIRPGLVVWENVRGALSASADSAVEQCPICVGDTADVHLRALGRVLGDLAELGYDAWWTVLRASDAGAPHARARVFVFAWTADPSRERLEAGRAPRRPSPEVTEPARDRLASADTYVSGCGAGFADDGAREPDDAWSGAVDYGGIRWGAYAPAVSRWEHVTGRPAPAPTEPGKTGQPRLSPAFVEWLMGLPDGHVTAVPGLTRTEQLKLAGNGVVPQQAALATRMWLDWMRQQ